MVGLTQVVDELALIEVPDEKRKGLLHLVAAHHDLAVAAHDETLEVAVLADLEQEHVVLGHGQFSAVAAARRRWWRRVGSSSHGCGALARRGRGRYARHLHEYDAETVAREQHQMVGVVQLEEGEARVHCAVEVVDVLALVQVEQVQVALD